VYTDFTIPSAKRIWYRELLRRDGVRQGPLIWRTQLHIKKVLGFKHWDKLRQKPKR